MTDANQQQSSNPPTRDNSPGNDPPSPIIKKMRWPFPIIWIVPIAAAVLAGYFYYQHHQDAGVELIIEFSDGSGIKPGQTEVQIHGVTIGHVQKLTLSQDHAHAIAHLRLAADQKYLTRKDTLFWLVRPELSLENVAGLNTILTGPYIEARPGEGPETTQFIGLLDPPKTQGSGLTVVLHGDSLGSVTAESPVTYLGIQVGVVQKVSLSDDADTADVTLFIWDHFCPLVRKNSVFWAVKAADLKGGLFTGVKLKLDSIRAVITGGVSFGTPEKQVGPSALDGAQFFLHDQPKDDWLKWRPRIHLPAEHSPTPSGTLESEHVPLPAPKRE